VTRPKAKRAAPVSTGGEPHETVPLPGANGSQAIPSRLKSQARKQAARDLAAAERPSDNLDGVWAGPPT